MSTILIVAANFYQQITDEMIKGAVTILSLEDHNFETVMVPGALEIPGVISAAHKTGKYDGYIAIGCVIRGETYHFEIVANESARGLMELSIQQNAAIGNGILTVEDDDQAWERASTSKKNKGADAARACLAMIAINKNYKI